VNLIVLLSDAHEQVAKLAQEARARGVLVRATLEAVVMSPPLTATEEHFTLVADTLGEGLDSLVAVGQSGASG